MIFRFSNIILKVNSILFRLLFHYQYFSIKIINSLLHYLGHRKTHLQKRLLSLNGTRSLMILHLCAFPYIPVNAKNLNYQLGRIWETIIEL